MGILTKCRVVTRNGMVVYRGERWMCYEYVMKALAKGSETGVLRIIEEKEGEE